MVMPILSKVLTPSEIADYLRTTCDVVIKELEEGRLRGFKVGAEWRSTEAHLAEYVNQNYTISVPLDVMAENKSLNYQATGFTKINEFDYKWPGSKEHFEYGYETTRNIAGKDRTFRIGFTNREAAGQNRRRVIVWMNNWPLVEFAGSNNFDTDGLLASVIKVPGGKQLRASGRIPEEYKSFRIAEYNSVIQGPFASRNLAVVVKQDDFVSMIKHAIIRATWKNIF